MTACVVCGWPQFSTPSGVTCKNGHGGAGSMTLKVNQRDTILDRIASAPRLHDNDNPLWQGPCGEGWNGGVTQSMLARFLSCRERFRLKYVCGLEPHDKWNHRLGYGQMWHVCEEALARGTDWKKDLVNHMVDMIQRYRLQQEEIHKWFCVCQVQFPEYVDYWRNHPDVRNRTPLLQEQVFDVPYTLPSGRVVRLRGRWDSVDLIDGGIYLQENKTKGDVDRQQIERQLSFDLQTMLYLVALQTACSQWNKGEGQDWIGERGLEHNLVFHPILGVRYNVIRRPLSGGKGNISPHKEKATKTKYTPAETAEQFYERLRRDYLAAEPDYWFFRIRAEISARDVQVFRETCLDPLLEQLCWWYDTITGVPCRVQMQRTKPEWLVATALHYRMPFGIYNALEDNGATEYDAYLRDGSEAGLRRTTELFTELK